MATTRTRKVRGSRTQALVAEAYQAIWPAATSAGGGAAGRDVLNIPLAVEVKGRRVFSPLEWIRQARKSAHPAEDEFPPHVVMRPDGVGEASVGDFLVIRRLCDDIGLMDELVMLRRAVKMLGAELQKSAARDVAEVRGLDLAAADEEDRRQAILSLTPDDFRRKRREMLEYTDRNGGLMSPSARAELEELRGN